MNKGDDPRVTVSIILEVISDAPVKILDYLSSQLQACRPNFVELVGAIVVVSYRPISLHLSVYWRGGFLLLSPGCIVGLPSRPP